MEILVRLFFSDKEQVRSLAFANEVPAFDLPALWILVDLPTLHRLAIKKAYESSLGFLLGRILRKNGRQTKTCQTKTQHSDTLK
jgi:hypothetical protein